MDIIKPIKALKNRELWRKKSKVTDKNLITREQLLYLINNFETSNTTRDRALIAFLYLTGCRVSEAVGKITSLQIIFEKYRDKVFIVIRDMPCLKRKPNNKAWRDVTIDPVQEEPFLKFVWDYVGAIPQESQNKPIFDFTRHQAYHIVRKLDDRLFPHYFRHLRCSDLTRNNGFNSAELRQYTGWTDDKPAAKYVHLNWRDVADKMMRR